MIEDRVRELAPEEREILERPITDGTIIWPGWSAIKTMLLWLGAACVSGGAALGLVVLGRSWGFVALVLLAIPAVILALITVCFVWFGTSCIPSWRAEKRRLAALEAEFGPERAGDLADGRAKVRRVTATRAIEMRCCHDEGVGYLFDVGDERTLVLIGQQYEQASDDWPCETFEIVRTSSGRFLALRSLGPTLDDHEVIEVPDRDTFMASEHLEEIVEGTPESVLRRYTG